MMVMTGTANPLSLPPYTGAMPAVITITCVCTQRYAVINAEPDAGGERILDLAAAQGAIVVDARAQPFMLCACGEPLDFSADAGAGLM